jgi:glucose-1-phosphate thymidylyltransferase
MKGIILAGGTGSRLLPLTKTINKALLPIGNYPGIYHPLAKLCEVGITEICIVTGTEHMGDIVNTLGSGKEWGVHFTYKVQDEPLGIAHAISLTENFVHQDKFIVLLGDNIFQDSLSNSVREFSQQKEGARIFLKEVDHPERFGVAIVSQGRITKIIEKPNFEISKLAVTGVYFYTPEVFKIIKELKPSKRGEYEVTDINNYYVKNNNLEYEIMKGWWSDAGTLESYSAANRLTEGLELLF